MYVRTKILKSCSNRRDSWFRRSSLVYNKCVRKKKREKRHSLYARDSLWSPTRIVNPTCTCVLTNVKKEKNTNRRCDGRFLSDLRRRRLEFPTQVSYTWGFFSFTRCSPPAHVRDRLIIRVLIAPDVNARDVRKRSRHCGRLSSSSVPYRHRRCSSV